MAQGTLRQVISTRWIAAYTTHAGPPAHTPHLQCRL